MIEIRNLNKTYSSKKTGATLALKDINLDLETTGMIFIVGRSGSGKSTFLNILGGLDRYNQGEIKINNTSLDSFKSKDFDSYRNSNIGFIFQDFNLIEEYNVYENIELSLSLQRKKMSNETIDNLLKSIGLKNFGERNINELSGGEKQRVSIARALIKNPNIILADEPSGSLDELTEKDIFEILKRISKEKLVIVVTHNLDIANKYADRIIEFSKGEVIYDSGISKTRFNNLKLEKISSKLPFLNSFKLSFSNLKIKKLKLLFTILLVTFALTFYTASSLMANYDPAISHAHLMLQEKEELVYIHKNLQQEDGSYQSNSQEYTSFNKEDIKKVDFILGKETLKVRNIYEDSRGLNFNIPFKNKTNTPVYYDYILSKLDFIAINNKTDLNYEIIGRFATENNEVVIHKYLADFIIFYGINSNNSSDDSDSIGLYKPKSYNQIISENRFVNLGSTSVKIVGIIDDDLNKYEELKNISVNDLSSKTTKLLNTFTRLYSDIVNTVYVSTEFIENLNLKENNSLDTSEFLFSYKINNENFPINSTIKLLNEEINIFDGKDYNSISNLNKSEIIINKELLNSISNDHYSEALENYIEKELSKEENILEVSDLEKQFLNIYLENNKIINSKINLEVTDHLRQISHNISHEIEDLKIIAYSEEEEIYLSKDILETYLHPKSEVIKLITSENDLIRLKLIFTDFPIDGSKYSSKTIFSSFIIDIGYILDLFSKLALYFSFGFLIFAIILLVNFINSIITASKKQIGILRALGTRKLDIIKIYLFESFIIGGFSVFLTIILSYIFSVLANHFFTTELAFSIKPIIFSVKIVIDLILSVLVIALLATILPAYKISNMSPVDAIYNK